LFFGRGLEGCSQATWLQRARARSLYYRPNPQEVGQLIQSVGKRVKTRGHAVSAPSGCQLVVAPKMSSERMGRLVAQRGLSRKAHSAIVRIAIGLGILMISASRSLAADDQPVLRIEAGMHTANMRNVSTDAAGRLALTVSEDETARLWEVATGRLIRVLRIEIGDANEGKLFCGALSPDGRLAAVGGWVSAGASEEAIYLFDTATGREVRRLTGLPNATYDLAFSADGRYLAVTLWGRSGLRLWEIATGREVGNDSDYEGESYGVDWSQNGQLVTTSYDGFLRLYTFKDGGVGPVLKLIKKSAVQGGKRPFRARFSPDGSLIAVGFGDSTSVTVVNGNDLSFRFAPDSRGVTDGDRHNVCWTDNGETLVAGGSWPTGADIRIRRWPGGGRGKPSDTSVSRDTILDLRPLPGGSILFAAFDPAWGVITKNGTRQTLGPPPIADYRGGGGTLKVSTSAKRVGFGFETAGGSAAQFDILQQGLLTDPKAFEILDGPRVDGLDVTDWLHKTEPKLAGKPLPLGKDEISRSLAVAQEASFFILGTEWHLRCFSSKGEQRWQIDSPGEAWAVNLADQDRLVLAAFGDGTIRWYRVQDGKELLAFFPHADRKRWVLWTPEGYYDCSAGGEDLIGWHVNRGREHEADFFPASKFREQFYRPDVIQLVLSTRDVSEALKQADANAGRQKTQGPPKIEDVIAKLQPPKIELTTGGTLGEVTLQPGAKDFTVHYRVRRGGDQPVESVLVYVDGRPVESAKAAIPVSDTTEASATTPIPEHDCVLALLAKNRFGFSELATLRLKRAPGDLNASLKPKVYLLAAGISRYAHTDQLPNLHFADKDARDFAAAFKRQAQAGGLYQKIEAKVLTDEDATAQNILDGLDWIQHETTSKDVAIIFFSGHGENDQQLRFFFCPHDFDKEHPSRTGVSYAQISESVRAISGKLLFFIDSCHAGNALGDLVLKGDIQVDMTKVVNELSSDENGAIVFASTTGTQLSQELENEHNGAFTKALVEGLDGQADLLHEGVITVASLETYVDERVKHLTNGSQKPTMARPSTIPNYPIAVK
jgi:dipeptidyl aminopeptidase/acylaminoacyl peptidase